MARVWLSITVELVEGGGRVFWPRPGRTVAAAATHSFTQFADAIDDAFARWDRAHLRQFRLADGRVIARPDADWGERALLDEQTTKLRILSPGERFVYEFDFGDGWHHCCTVEEKIDPVDVLGDVPPAPVRYFGWGDIPDQYGRRFADDDGEAAVPPDPKRTDLPPLFPWWGPGADRYRL